MLDCSGRRKELPEGDIRRRMSTINMVHELLSRLPEGRERFWKAFTTCMSKNPQSVRAIVTLMAFYLHVGPYSRYVIKQIDRQIEDLEQGRFVAPKLLPPVRPKPSPQRLSSYLLTAQATPAPRDRARPAAAGARHIRPACLARLTQSGRKPNAAAPMTSHRFEETNTTSSGLSAKRSVTSA